MWHFGSGNVKCKDLLELRKGEEFVKIGEECKKSRGSTEKVETDYIASNPIGLYKVVYTSAF